MPVHTSARFFDRMRKMQFLQMLGVGLLVVMVVFLILTRGAPLDWRTASRERVGLAPDPATTPAAVVQVYAARAWGWKGYFEIGRASCRERV